MSVLDQFTQGMAIANRAEAGATSGLMNRQAQQELKRKEQARKSNEDLAYLSDSRTGIYSLKDDGTGNVEYTLRADWKDQVEKYHAGGDSRLRFDKMASSYLSRQGDEVVKKRSRKTYGPTKTKKGVVPTAVLDRLEANPGDEAALALKKEYESGEKTAYIVPVENQEGMFSFLTRFGTDEADDEELIFSEREVEAYLSDVLISGIELEIDPDRRRTQSAVAQGVLDPSGFENTRISIDRAKALYDDDVDRGTKLGLLQSVVAEYNKNPVIKEQPPVVTEKEVTTTTPGADIDEKEYQEYKKIMMQAYAMGGNKVQPPDDATMRDNFRKSKGLPTASTTTETVRTETPVDPVEQTFEQAFPELKDLGDEQLRERVDQFINDGTFVSRGLSGDQVGAIRQQLQALNVQSMQDLKEKVDDGTVKNPYKYALSMNLALSNDKGLVNGLDLKTATDRTFNFLVSGDPNRSAGDVIKDDIAIAQEKRLRDDFDFNVSKYWSTKSSAARDAFDKRIEGILKKIPDLEDDFKNAMTFIRESNPDFEGDKSQNYENYKLYDTKSKTIIKDFANQYKVTDPDTGTSIYDDVKKQYVEKFGFPEDSFTDETFFRMAQPLGGNDLTEGRTEVALYNGYQQLVESNFFGAIWPFGDNKVTMKDFLGDIMAPNTPYNPTQFMKQKMAVRTNADGKPIELVIRTNNPKYQSQEETVLKGNAGRVVEGEASIRFDYLIKNNILPAEHIIAIIQNVESVK